MKFERKNYFGVNSMNENILELIKTRRFVELKKALSSMHPADLIEVFEESSERDVLIVFRLLPKELAADVFVLMDGDNKMQLIESFSDKELKAVFDELFIDDVVDIIEEMPASVVKRILKQTDTQTRKTINQILAYPDDSAGSIMTTEYINLKKNMTVADAFERIRKRGRDSKDLYVNYVTDNNRHLIGVITVKEMLLLNEDTHIDEVMETNVISVKTTDNKEVVAQLFDKYDFITIPVVDNENRLVGIVTVDDAIEVIQDAATEDIKKMAAITPTHKPYLKIGAFATFKARIVWLIILMLSATITGMIIKSFETALASQVILTAFIPMLMNTGGNSGSQSSVTIIRSLSLGEIEFKDTIKVLWKELKVSMFCAAVLSCANFIKMLAIDIWLMNSDLSLSIVLVVCLSLFCTVVVAKLVGSILPIIAKEIGFDPTIMASPFITTIVDILSLIIYFNLAHIILKA